ncbi:MAG TPA: hypothetical protein VE693_02660 [Gaiellaceae bacterium]|jgi:hypothetical protein|nr:hypothetical protein [Gaiellaceae bacterium]
MGKRLGLLAWLVPLGAAAVVAAFGTRDPADLPYFVDASRTLVSARWADTFADPSLQVGPLQLVLLRIGAWIGGLSFLAFAIELGLAALLVFVLGRLVEGRAHRAAVQTVVGLGAVVLGVTADAYGYGHPAQVAVPLLWVLAGLEARRGRTGRAGVLVGLSAGLEIWGVLGAPVLLLAPSVRKTLRGLAAQALVTGAVYLPFVLGGEFRMFEHRWKVEGWAPIRIVLAPGSDFPWTLRLAQGAAALAVGIGLALVLRRTIRGVWAVPLAVVAVRLLFDPTLYSWYWLGMETLTLLAGAELATSLAPLLRRVRGPVTRERPISP